MKAHELAAAGNPLFKSYLAATYAKAGRTTAARQILAEMDDATKRRAAFYLAQVHVMLGEPDEGLKWLEIAYDEHHPWMHWIRVDPILETLRSEPRYQALLRRMRFPER